MTNPVHSPAVSVCLPTYNYGAFLARAVRSVLDQTFQDFELLVFDNASTDNTRDVMREFETDARVTYVRHATNQGLFANFNLSFRQARGRYIKYLCADDWLDQRFLEETVLLLDADPDLVLATTANWLVNVDGALIGKQLGPFGDHQSVAAESVVAALASWGNVIGMPTNTLIRRHALAVVDGFDARYAPASDVHLWLKLLGHGDMGWISEPRCFIRIHSRHTHDYGPDPTESMFAIWRDAPLLTKSAVPQSVIERAMRGEARRSLLYVLAHLLRFRFRPARELFAFTVKYVKPSSAVASFLLTLPGQIRDQAERLFAIRTRRMVVYTPRPRVGQRLEKARNAIIDGTESIPEGLP